MQNDTERAAVFENLKNTESILPCPTCYHLPEVKENNDGSFELNCHQHGHPAKGYNMPMAIKHWNIYINFYKRTFLGSLGSH